MTATDDDRAKARELALLARSGVGGTELREAAIAEALAAERDRARAPFLAAVEHLRSLAISAGPAGQVAYEHAARIVERADQ